MSVDHVLRAIGTLACMYTVGLFVTIMSMATLSAAASSGGTFCSDAGCHMASYERPGSPPIGIPGTKFIRTAALILSAEPI